MTGRTARSTGLVLVAALLASLALLPTSQAVAAQTLEVAAKTATNTAVRGEQTLTVKGTVPGPVGIALLEALDSAGRTVGDSVLNSGIFRSKAQANGGDHLQVDGAAVSGEVTLDCLFSDPSGNPCTPEKTVVRQVRLVLCPGEPSEPDELAACRRAAEVRTTSKPYRVDFSRPFVRGYEVIAPDKIRVVFSEPVRHPSGDDSPLDWEVEEPARRVLAVSGSNPNDCVGRYLPRRANGTEDPLEDPAAGPTGCTRTLSLDLPLADDEQPLVTYVGEPTSLRSRYTDFAGNQTTGSEGANVRAIDKVLPALPSIERVAEDTTTKDDPRAESNDRDPEVVLGNLTPGQRARVVATSEDGARTVDTGWREVTGERMTLPLPPLAEAGALLSFTLRALAQDDDGNVSSGNNDGNRVDGRPNPVAYLLDARVPVLTSAVSRDADALVVTLSEPVEGSDDPDDWSVLRPDDSPSGIEIQSVTGSGAQRRLTPGAPDGFTLVYRPAGSMPYADAHDNRVPVPSSVRISGVPAPVVQQPDAVRHVTADEVVVAGTAPTGTVEVLRDTDGNGQPEPEVVARAAASEGRFAVAVPLPVDGEYAFFVRLVTAEGRSALVPVPRAVRDTVRPTLTLTRPAGGEAFPGGSTQQAVYEAQDRNALAVRIELSLDDGASYRVLTEAAPSSPYAFVLPRQDTEQARLRVTATDLARNATTVVSPRFAIDAVPPRLSGSTVDARTVLVRLSEPAPKGRSTALDWRVEGEPVSAAEESRQDGVVAVRLTVGPRTTIDADEEPQVAYTPSVDAQQYRDRADQVVPEPQRVFRAVDGIRPAVPVVLRPGAPLLTREDTQRVEGRGLPGETVEVFDAQGSRRGGPVLVAADGTWSLVATLALDSTNDLRAVARDTRGNRSLEAGVVPTVEQDASDPVVRVTEPVPGTRLAPGSRVAVRWTSADRNLVDRATTVQVSTDGGRTFTVLGQQQPASGSLVWDVPDTTTSNALVLVSTPDRAGRTGTGTSSPLGIGAEAEPRPSGTATPSGTASPSGTATPSGTASPSGPTGPGGTASPSGTPSPSPSATLPSSGLPAVGTFTAVTPARLLDTRTGEGAPRAAVRPGGTLRLQVAGAAGLPRTGVQAVVLNVTAVQPSAKTHVTVVPTGRDREATASLTAARDVTTATMVTARLGADGAVELRNEAGSTHLVADVFGWYAAADGERAAGFAPLAPQRLLDTREGLGAPRAPVPGQRPLELQVTGRGGVPADGVTSVVLNLVAVHPSDGTHVTAWAAGSRMPETSNLNALRRTTAANLVTVPVGRDGKVVLQTLRSGHLVADVFGWYGPAATDVLVPVDPARLEDTRERRQPLQAGEELVLRVAGRGGVPATGATAVVLTVSGVAPSRSTHLTLYAGGARTPETGNINIVRGQTATGQVIVPVGPDGTVRVRTGAGAVHVVADVAGWFRRG